MYYLVYGILFLLSLLPMWLLYVLSDGIYFLIYHVFGYRKEVVMENLAIAFPEKSGQERKKIAKQFYRNFIDSFIEVIKLISASDAFVEKRFTANWEEVNRWYANGQSAQLHLGHTFNWEWGNRVAAIKLKYRVLGVYMPIKNVVLDRVFRKLRSKTGSALIPATPLEVFRFELGKYKNEQTILGLIADQSPAEPEKAYWLNFFNRPTAFFPGPEKGARLGNLPVFFAHIIKHKRGHYEAVFMLAAEQPQKLTEGELTIHFVRYLEEVIRKYPDMWLWSHRRWKKEWKPAYQSRWIDKKTPAIKTGA